MITKALKISINGKDRCIAGIGDLGVVTAIVHWVKREKEVLRKRKDLDEEKLAIRVGGSFTNSDKVQENLEWVGESLAVSDEITIKILETDQITRPIKRRKEEPDRIAKDELRYYEHLRSMKSNSSHIGANF